MGGYPNGCSQDDSPAISSYMDNAPSAGCTSTSLERCRMWSLLSPSLSSSAEERGRNCAAGYPGQRTGVLALGYRLVAPLGLGETRTSNAQGYQNEHES